MATVTAEYLGDLRVSATHVESNTTIITDAPTDNGGLGRAFSPTDLTVTSLGTCALTILGLYAKNHDIDIKGTKMEIIKEMSAAPRKIARIQVTFIMPANNFTDENKMRMEKAVHACPVHKSLGADVVQEFIFNWS